MIYLAIAMRVNALIDDLLRTSFADLRKFISNNLHIYSQNLL
jgi:hypothetical protein